MLITKVDISSEVSQFSINIEDRIVRQFITEAEQFDLNTFCPANFLTDLTDPGTELKELLKSYIKPFLCRAAYGRFLTHAGAHITQFGAVTINDPTSQPISDKQRSNMIAYNERVMQTMRGMFFKKLKDDNYTYDSVTYDFSEQQDEQTSSRVNQFKIRPIG